MYPHRIRLRGPWECQALSTASAPRRMTLPCRWGDFSGRMRFVRHFGHPKQIDDFERVWLTCAGVSDVAEVRLNGFFLGRCSEAFEVEVTRLLAPRNELVIDVEGQENGGLWGEVALEIRCLAYLCDLRVWTSEAPDGALVHVAGTVAGAADRPLDLYVVLERSTIIYATVQAGQAFEVASEALPVLPGVTVRIELVNGASVWYGADLLVPV